MRTGIKVAAVGLLIGTGSCLTVPPTDPSKETIAAIAGRVVRPDGTGVGGPIVAVQLLTGFTPQIGSAVISVTAPIGSGLAGRDTSGIPVKLVLGRLATDTSYVQMELRPR